MPDALVETALDSPDFYIAAMGRSGSTMLCNWLTRPPGQLVFVEPFFRRTSNPRLLRIQLASFGLAVDEAEWSGEDATGAQRFRRLMGPRLQGKRWAFKEVLCEEHFAVLDAFSPPRVVITVRDIADVALSFFEKHRLQNNLDRFDDEWVRDYCLRESAGLLEFRGILRARGIPFLTVRYEDFTRSEPVRRQVAEFVGWKPGGAIASHLAEFDRGFEIDRHGTEISATLRLRAERQLGREHLEASDALADQCAEYQREFGYG